MRTPIKRSYGKRKRVSGQSELLWDDSIDSTPDAKLSAQPAAVRMSSTNDYLSAGQSAETGNESPATIEKKNVELLSIFEFDGSNASKTRKPDVTRSMSRSNPSRTRRVATSEIPIDDLDSGQSLGQAGRSGPGRTLSQGSEHLIPEKRRSPRSRIKPDLKGKQKAIVAEITINDPQSETDTLYEAELAAAIKRSRVVQLNGMSGESSDSKPILVGETSRNSRRSLGSQVLSSAESSTTSKKSDIRVHDSLTSPTRETPHIGVVCLSSTLPEIDLEPQHRPRTPPQKLISAVASPRVSPEHSAVFDAFESTSNPRPSVISRPRRLLVAMSKSKLGEIPPLSRQRSSQGCPARSPGSLAEDAENGLQEYFQDSADVLPESISSLTPQESRSSEEKVISEQRPTKATYSRQRSFLAEAVKIDDHLEATQSRASSPSAATDNDDAPQSDEDELRQRLGSGIKNLHELRQGGENKRSIDEIMYLLDGLDSSTTIQSTLIELAKKLSSKDFARRFRATDFDNNVLLACREISDPVSLFALMVIISVVYRGTDSTALSSIRTNLVRRAIDFDKDISTYLKDKRTKATKINRLSCQELRGCLAQSDAFVDLTTDFELSPKLLALMNLTVQIEASHDVMFDIVLPLIPNYLNLSIQQMIELHLISSMLEVLKLEKFEIDAVSESQVVAARQIVSLLLVDDMSQHDSWSTTTCNMLRFLIDLANNVTQIVPLIAEERFVGSVLHYVVSIGERNPDNADVMVLCLGLLVCLAEESSDAKTLMCTTLAIEGQDGSSMHLSNALQRRLKSSKHDIVAGYLALLLFHLQRGSLTCVGNNTTPRVESLDRDAIKQGLEVLKDCTKEVKGLQTNLSTYITSIVSG